MTDNEPKVEGDKGMIQSGKPVEGDSKPTRALLRPWQRQKLLLFLIVVVLLFGLAEPLRNYLDPEAAPTSQRSYIGNAYSPKLQISLDPTTHWQPRGGTIRIAIATIDKTTNLAGGTFAIDFRWSRKTDDNPTWISAPAIHVLQSDNPQKIILSADVPQLPDAPSHSILGVGRSADGIGTFLGLVPQADVRVIVTTAGTSGQPTLLANEVLTIGITSLYIAITGALVTIVAICEFILLFKPRGLRSEQLLLQLIEARGGRASLSQFQIMLWTILVGTAIVFVMALSGNLIPITQGALTLLGISGIATLGAQLKAQQIPSTAPALSPAAPFSKPSWSDLISGDGEIDVTRVQMLFFTVLVAIFVAIHVLDNYEMPPVPDSFLALMGISNGVYLVSKFVPDASGSGAQSSLSQSDAQARIVARNIKLVGPLSQNLDGSWSGMGQEPFKGQKKVTVAKDGTVSMES